MSQANRIEIASVEGGKYHRLVNQAVTREDGWEPRLMRCGRTLRPLNYFATEADADRYTGGRYKQYACSQCEEAVARTAIANAKSGEGIVVPS